MMLLILVSLCVDDVEAKSLLESLSSKSSNFRRMQSMDDCSRWISFSYCSTDRVELRRLFPDSPDTS